MKWVWRFSIYFIKPVLIWWICGYFGVQAVKVIANAISSYERAAKKAEIKARFEAAAAGAMERTPPSASKKNSRRNRIKTNEGKDNSKNQPLSIYGEEAGEDGEKP